MRQLEFLKNIPAWAEFRRIHSTVALCIALICGDSIMRVCLCLAGSRHASDPEIHSCGNDSCC